MTTPEAPSVGVAPPPPSTPPAAPSRGIALGSVLGFEISLDYSWFIVFFLILATFSGAVFPASAPGLGTAAYAAMGAVGALLFFSSLLFHELAHSVVARRKGVRVEGITLFVLGGMARTTQEASSPGDEFLIAGVGPLASVLLGIAFGWAASAADSLGLGIGAQVVLEYLSILNFALAIFNLLPGFPLDGGRLLRATLWKSTGSFRKATRTATLGGRILGGAIIALGIFLFFAERDQIGGLWLVFVGWFLGNTARASYQHLLFQEVMRPLTAGEAMSRRPESVAPDLPLDRLVEEYFLRRPYGAFPVTKPAEGPTPAPLGESVGAEESAEGVGEVVLGLVTLGQVKRIPREEWPFTKVFDIMSPVERTLVVGPDTPMKGVLEGMRVTGSNRAIVAEGGRLRGIISATDIARWFDRVGLLES